MGNNLIGSLVGNSLISNKQTETKLQTKKPSYTFVGNNLMGNFVGNSLIANKQTVTKLQTK